MKNLVRGIVGFVLAALLGIAILISFSETSERGADLAKELHSEVKKNQILTESQQIFNESSYNTLHMNVYGVTDQKAQDRIEATMRSVLKGKNFRGHVYLHFFPSREEVVKSVDPGRITVTEVKRGRLIRSIELQ